jgi:SAM-dependent methyltransferase
VQAVSCNLCGSDRYGLLCQGHDWGYGGPGQFTMVRCSECGLVFLNPRPGPEEMGVYYPDEYEPYQRARSAIRSKVADRVLRLKLGARVRVVRRLRPGGDLLDIGCGSGDFCREMSRRDGWRAKGVEINRRAASFAREQLGLDVFCGQVEDARFPDHSFDIVTMWDVLEHVRDPLRTLQEIERILRPGGSVICSTPHAGSLDARLFGRFWIGYDFPRHLYVFSPDTLGALLTKAGLRPERFFWFYGRYTTFALSVSLWINAHTADPSWQRRWRSWLLFPLFRYLSLPYFWLLDRLHVGAIVTVCARKAV